MPYDWATFLHDRVDKINPHADLAGIEQGGYKLVYKDKPSAGERTLSPAAGRAREGTDCWFSIGLRVGRRRRDRRRALEQARGQGAPRARRKDHRGERASLSQAMRCERPSATAKGGTEPIHLIVQADSFVSIAEIDYHDGERFPALERVDGVPAYLDDITKPLTVPEKAPAEAKKDEE